MHSSVRLVVKHKMSHCVDLLMTLDPQLPGLEPLPLQSSLAIKASLRHKPASKRCMSFCGCGFVCVYVCVSLH